MLCLGVLQASVPFCLSCVNHAALCDEFMMQSRELVSDSVRTNCAYLITLLQVEILQPKEDVKAQVSC